MCLGSVLQIVGGGVRTQVAGFEVHVLIDVSCVGFARNCWRRGSNPGRGVRSPSFDRCFLSRLCKMAGGGFRTQVAGLEVQGVRPQAAGPEVQLFIGFSQVDFANGRRLSSNPRRVVRNPSLIDMSWVDFAKLLAAGFEPRSRGSKSKFEWIFLGSILHNCRWRGSNPRRGVRSPSVNRCFLARFCKIFGGGVRTQVAGFEVQVLIDVSWVDFAELLAAGFEPRSRGSKSKF